MKELVILGAGGLGRQALEQLLRDYGLGREWQVAGFLDERGPDAMPAGVDYPWLGEPATFQPDERHIFVAAIGDPDSRRRQVVSLLARGAEFIPVRTRCELGARTTYGSTFFGYDVCCGVDCRIGNYGYIDQQTLLGHDVVTGDYVHIGPRCVLAGHVHIEDEAVVNPGAMIARGVRIGAGAVIGMGAVVFKDVPAGATVAGNPGRIVFQK